MNAGIRSREGWRIADRIAAAALRLALATALLLVASAAPARAAVVPVKLKAKPAIVKVAPGVKMRAWTFNGRVPGPVIRAREGDTIEVTLKNADRRGKRGHWHSVDFHASQIAPNLAFKSIPPGGKHSFSFVAERPGVYMYHCGTSPVLEHIGMGMYGAIIIDPAEGRPPAREITVVQSEFYGKLRNGRLLPSLKAMRKRNPKFVTFNGRAQRYARRPVAVPVGEPVRINFVDAGPNLPSAFHIVGEIFDRVEPDGNPDGGLLDVSTHLVAPGGGAVFELSFGEPGSYPFVSHAFRDADAGAVGLFAAG